MTIRRRLVALAGATVLTGGLAAGAGIAMPGSAEAGVCTGLTGALGSCTTVGTVTLLTGGLTMVSPTVLAWNGSVTGSSQKIYDTLPTDTALDVLDLRGLLSTSSTAGWNITASATPFTGLTTGTIIPDVGAEVLSFGGGSTTLTAANTPSSVCVVSGTCTAASDTTTGYPLSVQTSSASTPPTETIYSASAGTGTGIVQVGNSLVATGTNPAVWAVTLPPQLPIDAYTSTITMTIGSGP